ncbi:hypothetical protein [Nostoc sp. NZL]|uniref:hypothetical protein n=1 Tax=Nostoc sp. NZL TaxID=2650612 RepID=UPI0018C4C919|nr:hypothetical protein [Nostoc sp. NZL]
MKIAILTNDSTLLTLLTSVVDAVAIADNGSGISEFDYFLPPSPKNRWMGRQGEIVSPSLQGVG